MELALTTSGGSTVISGANKAITDIQVDTSSAESDITRSTAGKKTEMGTPDINKENVFCESSMLAAKSDNGGVVVKDIDSELSKHILTNCNNVSKWGRGSGYTQSENVNKLQCPVCSRRVASRSSVRAHIRLYTGELPYRCTQCPKKYTSLATLRTHEFLKHPEAAHQCPYCKKQFGSMYKFERHIKPKQTRYRTCSSCRKPFHRTCQYNTHVCFRNDRVAIDTGGGMKPIQDIIHDIKAVDGTGNPSELPDGTVADSEWTGGKDGEFESVVVSVATVEPVQDTGGDIELSSASSHPESKSLLVSDSDADAGSELNAIRNDTMALITNSKNAHSEILPVESMDESVDTRGLQLALRTRDVPRQSTMDREAGGGRAQCPVCSKVFSRNTYLGHHLRLHSGEKPYQCTLCPSRYALVTTLKSHMIGHARVEDGYQCPYCATQIRKRNKFKKHLKVDKTCKQNTGPVYCDGLRMLGATMSGLGHGKGDEFDWV